MTKSSTKYKSRYYRRDVIKFFLFLAVPLVGLALFYYIPAGSTLLQAFTDANGIVGQKPVFSGFGNFVKVFGDPIVWESLGRTFVYALTTGPISLFVSLLVAILLATNVKGTSKFRYIYLLVFILPGFATASLYKNLFNEEYGILSVLLKNLGIRFGYNYPKTAMLTVILTSMFSFGFKMLLFYAAIRGVPTSYYEAADLEGASKWRKFWSITIPAISPVLFLNIVLTTIDAFKAFDLPFLFGGATGAPAQSILLFSMYLRSVAILDGNYGKGSAMALMFFAFLLVLTLINFLLSKRYVNEDWE